MNAAVKGPAPRTTAEMRPHAWKWAERINQAASQAIQSAAAEPEDWKRADEAVRALEMAASAARVVRDSLPQPNGSPQDQMGWFKRATEDLMQALERREKQSQGTWQALPGILAQQLQELLHKK
jgi:hypothetical protein